MTIIEYGFSIRKTIDLNLEEYKKYLQGDINTALIKFYQAYTFSIVMSKLYEFQINLKNDSNKINSLHRDIMMNKNTPEANLYLQELIKIKIDNESIIQNALKNMPLPRIEEGKRYANLNLKKIPWAVTIHIPEMTEY